MTSSEYRKWRVNVVWGSHVVQDAQFTPLRGLAQPLQIAMVILRKIEEEFPLMASMSDPPWSSLSDIMKSSRSKGPVEFSLRILYATKPWTNIYNEELPGDELKAQLTRSRFRFCCYAGFKNKFILDGVNRANIQATRATETICWEFFGVNQTFCSLWRTCLYTNTAFGARILVNSDSDNAESFNNPWNKSKWANDLAIRTINNECSQ